MNLLLPLLCKDPIAQCSASNCVPSPAACTRSPSSSLDSSFPSLNQLMISSFLFWLSTSLRTGKGGEKQERSEAGIDRAPTHNNCKRSNSDLCRPSSVMHHPPQPCCNPGPSPGQLRALQRVELALLQQHSQVHQNGRLLARLGRNRLEALKHLTSAKNALRMGRVAMLRVE